MMHIKKIGKIKKYIEMRSGKSIPLPHSCTFEISTYCNLNCPMCYYKTLFKHNELAFKTIKFIIEKRLAGIIKDVYLIGAEPYLKPHLKEILRIFLDNGISVAVQTNGTLIISKKDLLPLFKQVDLSIDGFEKTHDDIRGKGSWEKTMEGLDILVQRKKLGVVSITVMEENLDETEDLIYFLKDKGAKYFDLSFLMWGEKDDIEKTARILNIKSTEIIPQPSNNPYHNIDRIAKIVRLKNISGVHFSPDFIKHLPEIFLKGEIRENVKLTCSALYNLRIDPMGSIIPCPFIRKTFGNLIKDDVKDVWNSPEFLAFRKSLISNNLYPVCKRCCRADRL